MVPNADQEVVEAAYRRLARKYHPDVSSDPDAAARMRRLNEAYAVLGDPQRRARYDRQQGPGSRSVDVTVGAATAPRRKQPVTAGARDEGGVRFLLAGLAVGLLLALLAFLSGPRVGQLPFSTPMSTPSTDR